MTIYKIGDILKARREELRISQDELSIGICDTTTLSRLENGKCIPSAKVFIALAQRLGLPEEKFMMFSTSEDFMVNELTYQITEHHVRFETEKTKKLISQLEQLPQAQENVVKQFILRSKARLEEKILQTKNFYPVCWKLYISPCQILTKIK